MTDLPIRFLVGGLIVSAFAIIGDLLKPKKFAGLVGAAPSVALATLGLTCYSKGHVYAAIEARSMMIGAVAFVLYALAIAFLMMRFKTPTVWTSSCLLMLWLAVALGLWPGDSRLGRCSSLSTFPPGMKSDGINTRSTSCSADLSPPSPDSSPTYTARTSADCF